MNRNRFVFFACLVFLFSHPGFSSASDYAEANAEKKSWVMSIGRKIEQKFKKSVESAVDDFFEEQMYKVLGEAIGEAIGKAFADSLSGFVSFGPFFSVTDILGIGSRSESQIMMQVLLEAIEEAKEEIINAVDELDRAEVIARLQTIKNALATHNARTVAGRQAEYHVLWSLKTGAEFVRQRMEQRPQTILSDLHYYMLMASMQISMEKEYTYWLMYHNDHPDFDFDEDIDWEIRNVVRTIVSSVNSALVDTPIGSLDVWREDFNDLFGTRSGIQYSRPILPSDDMTGLGSYSHARSGFFKYRMGDSWVEFLVLNRNCQYRRRSGLLNSSYFYSIVKYSIYDVAGNHVGNVDDTIGLRHCDQLLSDSSDVLNFLRGKGRINRAIDNHKNDERAFMRYMIDGYGPVKEVIDTWWPDFNVAQRPKSEVDLYFENYIEGHIGDLCLMAAGKDEDWDDLEGFVKFDVSVANCGYTDLLNISVSVEGPGNQVPDEELHGFYYDEDSFCPDGVICLCTNYSCSVSELSRGDSVSLSVVLSEALWGSAEVAVRAESFSDEISYANNMVIVAELD